MRIRCGVVAVLVALAVVSGASAQTYPIKFERPDTVGTTFRLDATGVNFQTFTQTVDGKDRSQAIDYRVYLSGDASVQAVTKRGAIAKMAVKVANCTFQAGKTEATPLVPAGATIVAEGLGKGQVAITVDGKKPDPETEGRLQTVLSVVASEDSADADKMFGTSEQKKAGDEWKPDTANCAKEISQTDMAVSPESLSGNVKIVEVKQIENLPCMEVVATINAKNLKPQMEGMEVQAATADVKFTTVMPTDINLPVRTQQMEVDLNITAKGPREDGKMVTLVLQRKSSTHIERTAK